MRWLIVDIKIDSLIPYDSLKTNIEHVFSIVDKNGKVVLLKDNKPAYIVLKYDENNLTDTGIGMQEMPNYTLHEAMRSQRQKTRRCMQLNFPMKYIGAGCI